MKIVIRAGGTGTRLWPWSRSDRPKQFLPMFDGKSCVQMACERFLGAGLAAPEDIYVSVGRAHEDLVRRHVPQVAPDHVIVEPARMDTAAAIGLETVVVAGGARDVIIASLGSDHYVGRQEEFVRALRAAEAFLTAHPQYLLAIACEPTRVETNYGHIRKGKVLAEHEGMSVHQAAEFLEKPDAPAAQRYTESGEYLWNANFFVWPSGALMDQFREFQPQMHAALMRILEARGTSAFRRRIEEVYPTLERIAIDYAVMEPAAARGRLAVLPVSMDWSDIGTWSSLTDAFPPDDEGNLLVGPVRAMDTAGSTVYVTNPARKLVAVIGLKDMAVVDTEDALLVCPKELAGRVKQMVDALGKDEATRDLV